jgi:molybdopterin-guanine dinucleotide biosynthesis protein
VSIPSKISKNNISGCVLAGGLSRRMGKDKAWLKLYGKPLIQHTLDMLGSNVATILLSANHNLDLYKSLNLHIVSDEEPGYQGPLMGLLSALRAIDTEWLVFAPCDLPHLPTDTVERLVLAQIESNAHLIIATDQMRIQPLVGLVNKSLINSLENFLLSGERKVESWISSQIHAKACFGDALNAFSNINTKDDFEAALLMPSILGISAWSGTGKTTLLKKLIPLLNDEGIRVGVIKHAHHSFEVDHPGKDSYEIRKSGASQMLIASDNRWALMADNPVPREPSLSELLTRMDLDNLDLVLVEGFKHDSIPKIELHRPTLGKPLIFPDDKNVVAIATDEPNLIHTSIPVLELSDTNSIKQFILALIRKA